LELNTFYFMHMANTSARPSHLRPTRQTVLLTLALAVIASTCNRPPALTRLDGATMGTTWSALMADAAGQNRTTVRAALQGELDLVVGQMSTWEPDSDISRFNRAAADSWQPLPPAFAEVMTAALELAHQTDGAWDPTVGPLVQVWGFGAGPVRTSPPDADAIAAARARVGWRRLRFEPGGRGLLQPGGVELDLAAIAEGYAVDRLGRRLEQLGVHDYLVEIGGEVRARGLRPDGRPWRLALERPDAAGAGTGTGIGRIIELAGLSAATSGDSRAFFEHDGRRYGHAIDTATGWPVRHGLAAVTVLAQDCIDAGSLASALSVLGPDRGAAFARERDIAALFLVRQGDTLLERPTPAFLRLIADGGD
jgi:thiamine biosynthesis lipoprotein